jgi:hypothetical protein
VGVVGPPNSLRNSVHLAPMDILHPLDLSNANTEAFIAFLRYREALNAMTAVGTAGFTLLRNVVGAPNGDRLMGALVDSADEPWARDRAFPNPQGTVDGSAQVFCNMGVMQVLSAFEWFSSRLVTDALEFAPRFRDCLPHEHVDCRIDEHTWARSSCCATEATRATGDLGDRIESLAELMGAPLGAELGALLPLFHYFRLARNRITHANGLSGESLTDLARSPELEAAVVCWNRSFSKREIRPLPSLRLGEPIRFRPHHVVLAGAVCHEFAVHLNRAAVGFMDSVAITRMAAYYAEFAKAGERSLRRHHFPESSINLILTERYHVRGVRSKATIELLRHIGVWEAVRRRHSRVIATVNRKPRRRDRAAEHGSDS